MLHKKGLKLSAQAALFYPLMIVCPMKNNPKQETSHKKSIDKLKYATLEPSIKKSSANSMLKTIH